jgi:hypothetical protein
MMELSGQQSLQQEVILRHELNHRVNNEFAAAINVVSLAAAHGTGLEKLGVKTSVSRRASWYAGGEVKRC